MGVSVQEPTQNHIYGPQRIGFRLHPAVRFELANWKHEKLYAFQNATNQQVHRKILLNVPSGTYNGPPAVTLIKWLKYKRELYLLRYTSLTSNWITNVDHMCIPSIEPSSVILSQANMNSEQFEFVKETFKNRTLCLIVWEPGVRLTFFR